MTKKIAILPGDGIGLEIIAEAEKLLHCLRQDFGFELEMESAAIGGAGYDAAGHPLPEATLKLCQQADAILLGAVGGPQYESLERDLRPERGLLGLRAPYSYLRLNPVAGASRLFLESFGHVS